MLNVLEIDSVMKSFGSNRILSDVYLKCQTGDIIGILGRNGCGKSTLLKIIFGNLQADQKTIKINNQIYTYPYRTKNLISYLPQHTFLPENCSLKNIVNACIKDPDKRNIILKDERISKHITKTTNALSGGELRYFEILLLVNLNTKFILLDEPFSGIEPIYKDKIKELIKTYQSHKGFIITDHDYRNIIEVSDRIVLITNGACKNIDKLEQLEEYNYLPTGTLGQELNNKEQEDVPLEFKVDKQTLEDLNLFENNKGGLVYSIFNKVKTIGGERQLTRMLETPISNINILEERRDSIKFFNDEEFNLKIEKDEIDYIEYYLGSNISFLRKNKIDSYYQSLKYKLKPTNDYYTIKTGIQKTVSLLNYIHKITIEFQNNQLPQYLSRKFFILQEILMDKEIREITGSSEINDFSAIYIARLDHFFRKTGKQKIQTVLKILYEFDVFESTAKAAVDYQLSFPVYSNSLNPLIQLDGLFHPLINNPVSNNFKLGKDENLCFLTGANMSGKSTFQKAFGLAVYLSHVGFPVPANRMETTIFNGLVTTINLSDNIFQGYSHFYSEVRRVKEAASIIKNEKKIVVIFDELFRGTNVKDAFDASLLVTEAMSKIQDSMFLISSHIVEIAGDLKKHKNIFYNCFESKIKGETPIYSYKLKNGISEERFGMQIVKNEKIVELLEEAR